MKETIKTPYRTSLLAKVVDDCIEFGRNLSVMPLNERHLQVLLCIFLKDKSGDYENVHLEYSVPYAEMYKGRSKKDVHDPQFPWNNDIAIDLVIEKDEEFVAIELKYSTHTVEDSNLTIFGEKPEYENNIIKTQGASDIAAYSYWKDVRRIERLMARYPKLVGGIAMMVSNVSNLWDVHHSSTAIANLALTDNVERTGDIVWPTKFSQKVTKSHPAFHLDGKYMLKWESTKIEQLARNRSKDPFKFVIAVVDTPGRIIEDAADSPL